MKNCAGADIPGVRTVPHHVARDQRGSVVRVWPTETPVDEFTVRQVLLATNKRARTLRGLHFQVDALTERKIVGVIRGSLWDVVVDLRRSSATYLEWSAYELSADAGHALFIPAGLAHGYLTLENDTEVSYLLDQPYEPGAARGVAWNEPRLAIAWPAEPQTISQRDQRWPPLPDGFCLP